MRAMKDSGIEWIGEIPQEWNLRRIKTSFDVFAGATPKSGEANYWNGDIPWITPADFTTDDVYVASGHKSITQDGLNSCATTIVPKGSIIFSKRAPVGLVAINSNPLCTNQGCLSCVPKECVDAKYYYYVMSIYSAQFDLFASGTTFKEISADVFANFKLPCLDYETQKRIASCLDAKCAEIDALIAAKEKTNALLKERRQSIIYEAVTKGLDLTVPMKDSGVEWIGKIPETWSTRKAKYMGTFRSGDGITSESISDDDKYPVYGGNGIRGYTDRFTHEGSYILIGRQGALCGNVHLVSGAFWASEHAVVGSINQSYDVRMAFYILTAFNLNRLSITAAQPGLSVDQIINVVVPMPNSMQEQKEICDYLDNVCKETDSAIELNEKTTQQLKEYRQSLIYEAVTGKIEV